MRAPRAKTLALVVLGAVCVAALLARAQLAPRAEIGAGFVAKQLCSCIFVGERELESCQLDLGPEFARVRFERSESGVHAWVPLLASRNARHREDTGCTLD